MERRIPLEPAADEVCTAASKPPLIFQLPYKEGRKALEEMQDSYVYKFPANIKSIKYNTGDWGSIPVYIVTPEKAESIRSVIFYIHGAGWVFGSFHTHEKLVRELAARTESLVVFPEYTRSPEAKFPTAIEQCYKLLCDVPVIAAAMFPQVDINTLTVAGDSVGGNMAIDMSLMSKFRDGPAVSKQLLYYPVTNDNFNTSSYLEFAEGYYLYRQGMMWFWDQYAPEFDMRNNILACPLKADITQLEGLPQTMIINGQADVLRDEGESFGERLRTAGADVTAVRIQGIIHDFVMLNALDTTLACRAAMNLSTDWINQLNMLMEI